MAGVSAHRGRAVGSQVDYHDHEACPFGTDSTGDSPEVVSCEGMLRRQGVHRKGQLTPQLALSRFDGEFVISQDAVNLFLCSRLA